MGGGFAGGVLRGATPGARASRPLFRAENSLRTGKSREFLILEQGIDSPETGNSREFSSSNK
jgi:hypothetical protein